MSITGREALDAALDLRNRAEKAEAIVGTIQALHAREDDEQRPGRYVCANCDIPWPCGTARALNGGS